MKRRRGRVGNGTLWWPPRFKPHIWLEDGCWWVFDPLEVLPIQALHWGGAVLVAAETAKEMGL